MRNLTKVTQLRSGQRDSNPSGLGLNPSLAPSSSYSPASPPPNHLHKRETLKDRTTDKEPCSHQLNNRSYTFQRHRACNWQCCQWCDLTHGAAATALLSGFREQWPPTKCKPIMDCIRNSQCPHRPLQHHTYSLCQDLNEGRGRDGCVVTSPYGTMVRPSLHFLTCVWLCWIPHQAFCTP